MSLTGFVSARFSLARAGRLVAGGSLAVFLVIYFVGPASPVSAPKEPSSPLKKELAPGDVAGTQGAFMVADEQLRTYLDRARDLRDAFARAGRDPFVKKKAQTPLNEVIHAYNPVREELAKKHERYVVAITQQTPHASAFGSEVDALLNQVESLHKECVLPLNDLGKAMDELAGKKGRRVERQRAEQGSKLAELLAKLDAQIASAESALKTLEQHDRRSL
jgi:hypothetical protein